MTQREMKDEAFVDIGY